MGFLMPFFWVGWIFQIFFGFTFTDWQDFIPIIFLLGGIGGVVWVACSPRKPLDPLLQVGILGLSAWPLYPHYGLYFLALQAKKIIGSWPQPMANDPKWMEGKLPGYDFWFHAVNYVEAFAGAASVVFFAALIAWTPRLSPRFRKLAWCAFGAAVVISLFDPGRLYEWWID